MKALFNPHLFFTICLCTLFLGACSKPAEPAQPAPQKAQAVQPAAEEEEPPADQVPVAEDFQEEVKKEIGEANYLAALQSLEKELAQEPDVPEQPVAPNKPVVPQQPAPPKQEQ